MWFWIGLALVLLWGGWGYWRRIWWLRAIARTEADARGGVAPESLLRAPPGIVLPDRVMTAIAGAAAIIGLFLVIGSRWGWL